MNRSSGWRRRRRAQRMYRLLVRLYPTAHRRAFGEQMVQMFGDHYRDAVEGRGGSRLRFWLAVLADAGSSLVTEHAAEAGTRLRQVPKWALRRRRASTRTDHRGMGGVQRRRARVARRLRYRRRCHRPVRVVIRTRRHQLVYRGRVTALIVPAASTGAALGAGTVTGHPGIGAVVAGLIVVAWLVYSLRLTRPVLSGSPGDGPAPPGGASVREPRRPLPVRPAGSAARPRPDQDGPGQAIALI
ncbi:hypothetical protein AB0K00_18735 [Dactylosporangium sp. NPDC049525]|uniref:hypothetical protein n=1 Tax=Dactylosporangium sp. NPDC049525 TaxID=3154730 RepID=UPI00342C1862